MDDFKRHEYEDWEGSRLWKHFRNERDVTQNPLCKKNIKIYKLMMCSIDAWYGVAGRIIGE